MEESLTCPLSFASPKSAVSLTASSSNQKKKHEKILLGIEFETIHGENLRVAVNSAHRNRSDLHEDFKYRR